MLHASELIIGSVLEFLPETDSTQRYLIERLAGSKIKEGTLVYTDYQTAGKGQAKGQWHSEKGQNLLYSFVLYPYFLKADQIWRLSQMISVAVVAVLETYIDFDKIKIKWPNDILINERKSAGILIQNQLSGEKIEHSVIGIGININQKEFPECENIRFPPTSLSLETGSEFNTEVILHRFCERANFFYEHLKNSSASYLENLYLESLFNYGKLVGYQVSGENIMGIIEGTLPDGRLILKSQEGKMYLQPKEIVYV